MADNDQLLHKIGNLIDQKLEPVKKDLRDLKQDTQGVKLTQAEQGFQLQTQGTTLAQLKTTVEAVAAGQKELCQNYHKLELTQPC